jgi:hypothetical protein
MVMLDAITHERLVVRQTEFGPSILLHDYEDLDFLEDAFVEQHDIETGSRELPVETGKRCFELFVHSDRSLAEIQALLDAMSYERHPAQKANGDATSTI